MKFNPESIGKFCFEGYEYDDESHRARLFYSFDDSIRFAETYEFKDAAPLVSNGQQVALDRALRFLHLISGVSYYKAAAPNRIEIKGEPLSFRQASYFEKLYRNGLAEFSYINRLNLRNRINFPFSPVREEKIIDYRLSTGIVVPLGGGKDSIVTMEILNRAKVPIRLLNVGENIIVDEIIGASNLGAIRIKRTLSRNLFELNENGAYNGHVPISAILAFVFLTAGILYGFDTVIVSNERSANVGANVGCFIEGEGNNTEYHINHQYSKSFEFEQDFREFVCQNIIAGFDYYSLLRPLSELMIGRIFSKFHHYHDLFVSCNKAFAINCGHGRESGWCNRCPKCRFVFLSLAPFLEKEKLLSIFGENLLNAPSQMEGFSQLMGIGGIKPFDCVGEEKESIAAMILLRDRPEWKEDCIIKRFSEEVYPVIDGREKLLTEVFDWSDEHNIPLGFEELLREYL
ncbi:MAG: hypothetical protein BECKG1743D_GA0114223_101602 [Candidatus Kentron sp. G]|nr:MAG: hypothetical protein BECKG1743D_GA0114223_101602 [Candidatus Kentron sp. G]